MSQPSNTRSSVEKRYADAAKAPEAALCCPVEYDRKYLEVIPDEVIEKDYGCGDPSKWVHAGETVLDLGSGTGKICFIASQVVGAEGKVIGVDMTDDMLEVANRNAPIIADRIGYANVEFRKGRIQDLGLDLDRLDAALQERPVANADDYLLLDEIAEALESRALFARERWRDCSRQALAGSLHVLQPAVEGSLEPRPEGWLRAGQVEAFVRVGLEVVEL